MNKENTQICLEDFIKNPTRMSQGILDLAKKAQVKNEKLLSPATFVEKVKFRILYKNEFNHIYDFIERFDENALPNDIAGLYVSLGKVFHYISLNNVFLAYSFIVEKEKKNPLITKEDEKLLLLSRLYGEEIGIELFNEKFGHYALNAFELSSKRFCEYSKEELMKVAVLLKDFDLKKEIYLRDYLKVRKRSLFAIYATLREELKYVALLVIKNMRVLLLKIEKENGFNNIFNMRCDEI